MLRKLIIAAVAAAVVGLALFWLITAPERVSASALPAHTPDLANGKTMFYAGGCTSCHTMPSQQDKTRLGGGRPLPSPFGTFYVPNISPHPTDGIGGWSEADFVTAMSRGATPDERHFFPAFPYTSYHNMLASDLRDMFAYLKTLPPVEGRVRDHDVPFPFNVRRLVGGWKFLFFDSRPFRPDPTKSAEWNRGAYLVNGPGHCAECHSPRNMFGAIIGDQRFAGGPNPEGEGWVPNITQLALGRWSERDFEILLESGELPEKDGIVDWVGSNMAEVVRNTGQLSPADRKAMAVYLKSLAPIEGPTRPRR